MNSLENLLSSPMWRRLAAVLAACALLPLLAVVLLAGRELEAGARRDGAATLSRDVQALSAVVASTIAVQVSGFPALTPKV